MWNGADEERKVVTVLFADLVGSTELSGRLDPEILRAVLLRYFTMLATQIERQGGTVEKFIGDAVMAVFGVPVTHEDDARRALAAATGIIEALRDFNVETHERHGIRLQLRIGVNTGEAIAARDPGLRQSLVSGEIVNLAARLEQHAGADEVLIGAATYSAAGAAAVTGSVRSLLVKGKTQPIQAYPLLGLLPDDPATTRRFDVPFIGRTRELAVLDSATEWAATTKATNLMVVYGDPGVGKTRLLTEWLARMPPGPAAAMTRCRAYTEDGSLRPLLDLATQLTSDAALPVDASRPLRDRIASALGGDLRLPDLYRCLVDFIAALADKRTVVLVVDDAQWASTLLLETIDRLCGDLRNQPLLCVCAARTNFADARPRLGQDLLNVASISLGPMPEGEAAEFASALLDVTAHSAETVRHLVEHAEGNPFYLEQLVAACHDGHEVGRIPPTIRALVAARLDVLPPDQRRTAELASVIGREFAVADLATLLDLASDPVAELSRALDVLTRRRLLQHHRRPGSGSLSYRFASTLIHDVTYESMTKTRRATLHERAAAAAVPAPVNGGAAAGGAGKQHRNGRARVGRHLELAYKYRMDLGEPEGVLADLRRRAILHLVAAGSAALHSVDLPWALDLLGRAADLALPQDPAGGLALERYGEALHASGERRRALEALTAAREHALAHGDHAVAAHASLVIAQLDPAAGPVADVARKVASTFAAAGDELGLARTHLRIGTEFQSQGRYAQALGKLEAALAYSVRAGTDFELANALGAIGQSLWLGPEPVTRATARCRALFAEHGTDRGVIQATLGFPLTMLLAIGGDSRAAADQLAVARRAMTDLRYGEAPVFRHLLGGLVAMLSGDTEEAIAELGNAREEAGRLGSGYLTGLAARELARAMLDAGRVSEAARMVATARARATAGTVELADLAGLRAWCAGTQGDGPGAMACAGEAIALAKRTDSPITVATAYHDQARALRGLGSDARAAAAAARRAYLRKGHLVGAAAAARLAS